MKKGFTLIELLVVVLIIGVLSAVALPQYTKAVERARATEAMTNLRAIVTAQEMYKMANGEPTTDFEKLDIQLAGSVDKYGRLILPHFMYVLEIRDSEKEYETIAYREGNGSGEQSYYIYYSYKKRFSCVAQQEAAKSICSTLCANVSFTSGPGGFYCIIS